MKHIKTISEKPACAAIQVPIIGTIDIKGSAVVIANDLLHAAGFQGLTKNNDA